MIIDNSNFAKIVYNFCHIQILVKFQFDPMYVYSRMAYHNLFENGMSRIANNPYKTTNSDNFTS